MQFKRADRVAALLREEISKIVEFEISDPRLGFVTVTAVEVTDDLRHAKIFCGILGDPATVEKSLDALAESSWRIRKAMAGRVQLRRVPEITFHLDVRAEKAARIDTLLRKIHEEEATSGGGPIPEADDDDDEDDDLVEDDDDENADDDDNDDDGDDHDDDEENDDSDADDEDDEGR
jgi:ribosome-binding factor A